jgi:putative two-component system protein, hydrogenase maturation factor HypX/HoxX
MKILFIVSSFNGLSQRAWIELDRLNHQVKVHVASTEDAMKEAVSDFKPDLIIAPYLKKKIPAEIYSRFTCFIVHPGIVGDRGSCSLDWAILKEETEWGVTIIQATEKMDAGPAWATETFMLSKKSKSSVYRHELTQAAIKALLRAIEQFEKHLGPEIIDVCNHSKGSWNRATCNDDFHFDWKDNADDIIRKIHAADSSPGVLLQLGEEKFFCFGAHKEETLKGAPGQILAKRNNAICIAAGSDSIWLTHLKKNQEDSVKLPATLALGDAASLIKEDNLSPFDHYNGKQTFREILYEESNDVGFLHFDFYNGAMSSEQCMNLRAAFNEVKKRNVKVIVLCGGSDLWSNGIHLNIIEASDDPAKTAWENILAIDDLIEDIIRCDTHYVISSLHGNAGGGGVPFALAADKVIARKGIVLNPHTHTIGLYGSEYWTYLLPRRIGTEKATQFTEQCLPWGTEVALEVKLIDECIDASGDAFNKIVKKMAEEIAALPYFDKLLQAKQFKRRRDEAYKPLQKYREEELMKMWKNFFEDDNQFDLKRYQFLHKKPGNEGAIVEGKDLYSERRKIWRRRKYEPLYYETERKQNDL